MLQLLVGWLSNDTLHLLSREWINNFSTSLIPYESLPFDGKFLDINDFWGNLLICLLWDDLKLTQNIYLYLGGGIVQDSKFTADSFLWDIDSSEFLSVPGIFDKISSWISLFTIHILSS